MALTKEDLQAIGALMDSKLAAALEPINNRLDAMQADIADIKEDIEIIKEDTTVTRDVVNGVSEWTEIASGALKIQYPVPARE